MKKWIPFFVSFILFFVVNVYSQLLPVIPLTLDGPESAMVRGEVKFTVRSDSITFTNRNVGGFSVFLPYDPNVIYGNRVDLFDTISDSMGGVITDYNNTIGEVNGVMVGVISFNVFFNGQLLEGFGALGNVYFDVVGSGGDSTNIGLSVLLNAGSPPSVAYGTVFRIVNVTQVDVINLPTDFKLFQNYPNPFNPTTNISYTLRKAGQVRLTIFNILGQEINALVDTFQNAGQYISTWNGIDQNGLQVSSGVYIYLLEAGNYKVSRRMTFTK